MNEDASYLVADNYRTVRPTIWNVLTGEQVYEAKDQSSSLSFEQGWLIGVRRNLVEVLKVGQQVEPYNRFRVTTEEKGISVSGLAIIDAANKLLACSISQTEPVVESWIQIFDFDGNPVGPQSEISRGRTIRLIRYIPHLSAIGWPRSDGALELFDSSTLKRLPEEDVHPSMLIDRLIVSNAIGQFEFFDEGRVLAYMSGDNTVRVRAFSDESETVYEFPLLQSGWLASFAREAGTFVAVTHNTLALWGSSGSELLAVFSGNFGRSLSISEDGSMVAVSEKTGAENRMEETRLYRTADLISAYALARPN